MDIPTDQLLVPKPSDNDTKRNRELITDFVGSKDPFLLFLLLHAPGGKLNGFCWVYSWKKFNPLACKIPDEAGITYQPNPYTYEKKFYVLYGISDNELRTIVENVPQIMYHDYLTYMREAIVNIKDRNLREGMLKTYFTDVKKSIEDGSYFKQRESLCDTDDFKVSGLTAPQ